MLNKHSEFHRSERIGWLRAAVLGANDGIVSTASLIVGVAAAHTTHHDILISGVAALVAGAMSMAAGEYVSVSSQSDTEEADLARERDELLNNLPHEREELTQIYVDRGLDRELAIEVSRQLMEHDALGSHARDELGISHITTARPIQAALTSAGMFAGGALLPIIVVVFSAPENLILSVSIMSLIFLAILGMLAARAGGANMWKGGFRVVLWGSIAMALTAGVGALSGVII
jgi:VIT1/CCC1 family predicted Fe2+/Mn2+ transporter